MEEAIKGLGKTFGTTRHLDTFNIISTYHPLNYISHPSFSFIRCSLVPLVPSGKKRKRRHQLLQLSNRVTEYSTKRQSVEVFEKKKEKKKTMQAKGGKKRVKETPRSHPRYLPFLLRDAETLKRQSTLQSRA